ncbi:WhiB family transcriptional regulator [Streptomyces ambofaciens]
MSTRLLNIAPAARGWSARALCGTPTYRDRGDELWFANPLNTHATDEAKRLCFARCPVRQQCLHEAMRLEGADGKDHRHGVQGGLTGRERHALYLELRRRVKARP